MPESRSNVFVRALETAVGVGKDDPSDLFTDDVRCWSPALNVSSLADLSAALEDRDEALSNVTVSVRSLNTAGNKVIAEWRLDADHTGPITLSEDYTVEPTGRHVHVGGATFAEFRGDKIEAFRSYFDDLALIEQLTSPD
jgi:predicted ester cyclase